MKYTVFNTQFGFFGIVGRAEGLMEIFPFLHNEEEAESLILSKYQGIEPHSASFKEITEDLQRYFSGDEAGFEFPLDFSGHSEFQRNVWDITRSIPYGEARTYGWVSRKLGNIRYSRAVGSALAKNPFPILVPCHRVVRGDGRLGGYSARGGIGLKTKLLEMEGCEFDSRGRIRRISQ